MITIPSHAEPMLLSTWCNASSFPSSLAGIRCHGLTATPYSSMGAPITRAEECMSTCCAESSCTLWNFKLGESPPCWTWSKKDPPTNCSTKSDWVGGGARNVSPTPSPGGHESITLPATTPPATKLKFAEVNTTSKDGTVLTVDSRSLLENGKRIYPISGEVHVGRLPASQWREELMRMKAGGLTWISVYVLWIYFEEQRGTFTFSGRRDIRAFLQVAHSLGLRVHLRIGPWCHAEVRNGGHPDWVLSSCGKLRSTATEYLNCVSSWFSALAGQLKGLYWKDGGPVVLIQLDNETRDFNYLLSLRSLAMGLGILPAFFMKTGWPTPRAAYPKDYPILPLFGGYPDDFWSNSMAPDVSVERYAFATFGDKKKPAIYPWLDVEIGGGMAAAYSHRLHMDPDDMPSMHLVDVGSGVNMLGYYMYHGGNNPHSVLHDDAPENTLQESSFQPAGAKNPMPSLSYDFFAPLGEFGQPRPHFHSMRRLHLLAMRFGSDLAATDATFPDNVSDAEAQSGLRWSVRSNGRSGWLFVNNYERLTTLPKKEGVRFKLRWSDGERALEVPSNQSSPLTVPAASWFVWPFGLGLFSSSPGPQLAWATAQLLTQVDMRASSSVIFLVETSGILAEVALDLSGGSLVEYRGNLSVDGSHTVLRDLHPGTDAVATILYGGQSTSIVLLPAHMADKVWVVDLAGTRRVIVSDGAELVLGDASDQLRIRTRAEVQQLTLLICPGLISLRTPGGPAFPRTEKGVFSRFDFPLHAQRLPQQLEAKLFKAAGPPRTIPTAPSGKPQEPSAKDWLAAAEYHVLLPGMFSSTELRLAIDYAADCARVYLGDTLLTDNWLSGYYGSDGGLEVGLSYLSSELPSLVASGTVLRVLLLPLQKATLQKRIWLQPSHWPDFRNEDVACRLDAVRVLGLQYTTLVADHLQISE